MLSYVKSNVSEPIVFEVDEDFAPQTIDFVLAYSANDGDYSSTDTISMNVGPPRLLIVDDDLASEYEEYLVPCFDSLRISFVVWGKDSLSTCSYTPK